MSRLFLLVGVSAAVVLFAAAGCDNSCSGHGTCGEQGVCNCYDNWAMGFSKDSGDCSDRVCPYEFAWVDNPSSGGAFHKYAECSARGICDRTTGQCDCMPGYEGKACQRTTCPNDCSGHGQCSYIEDLPFTISHMAYEKNQGYSYDDDPVAFSYYGWDEMKTRGCLCDPEYGDVDCSKRLCQFATDVMDGRPDMEVAATYHTQHLTIVEDIQSSFDEGSNDEWSGNSGKTFALKFISKTNETFYTTPINMPKINSLDYTTNTEDNAFEGGCLKFSLAVQNSLIALPNGVIGPNGVKVHATCNQALTSSANDVHQRQFHSFFGGDTVNKITFLNVTFTGTNVQGHQHPLEVMPVYCGDGCTPKLGGLEYMAGTMNSTELITSDFNSYECGNRGKCDYDTGVCNCFPGYTGAGCNVITSLV